MREGQSMLASDESTPFCAWSDDYYVGIQKMDKQHRGLLLTMNNLYNILMSHGEHTLIDKVLSDLIHQTKVHFHTEEELMQAHDYPGYQDHKELHDLLLCQLESVLDTQQKLKSHHMQQSWAEKMELADFLGTWFVSHIVDADRKLGVFLKSNKVE